MKPMNEFPFLIFIFQKRSAIVSQPSLSVDVDHLSSFRVIDSVAESSTVEHEMKEFRISFRVEKKVPQR